MHGGSPKLQLWRATSEVPNFITLASETRTIVSSLIRFIREFCDSRRNSGLSVSAMVLASPGCGSTYLVRTIAKKLKMFFLAFNLTQCVDRDDVTTIFEVIEHTQSQQQQPALVFIDELTSLPGGLKVYDLFQAAVKSGAYTRSNWDHVRFLKPAVWIFKGNPEDKSESERLMPVLTHGFFDLTTPLSLSASDEESLVKLENVYVGVSILRRHYPDVTDVSVHVLKAFAAVDPATRGRQLSLVIKHLRHVQLGSVTEKNLTCSHPGLPSQEAIARINCEYSDNDIIRILD